MKGNVIKYAQDNIDTDVIIPGQYLKVHDYAELATHAMEGLDPDFHLVVSRFEFLLFFPLGSLLQLPSLRILRQYKNQCMTCLTQLMVPLLQS